MSKVRTRFAPSPTGRMHVGNLRSALYEFLIAKHAGGDFMLRIEDTDQERFVEGAVDIIYHTLEETGLVHDEGPDKDGGYGPYVQSERMKTGIYIRSGISVTGNNVYRILRNDRWCCIINPAFFPCGSKSDAEAGCTDLPCIYHGNPYDSGICIRTYVYPCDGTGTIRRTAHHVTLFDRYDQ